MPTVNARTRSGQILLSATANGWVVRVTKGTGVCAVGPPAPVLISPATTGITTYSRKVRIRRAHTPGRCARPDDSEH